MPVNNVTANQSYQLPHPTNQLDYDVGRIISAINGIDANVAALFASLSGKAATSHSHAISDVTGLTAALAGKLGSGDPIAQSQVTNLVTDLAAKAALAGADFVGPVTGVTPSLGANNTQFATTAWVRSQAFLTAVITTNIADRNVTLAKIEDAPAVSVLARSANSSGVRADLAASANGGILSRLSNALGFNTLTALLDAIISGARGTLLWRSASAWGGLAPAVGVLRCDGQDISWGSDDLWDRIILGTATPINSQTFTSDGNWTKPAGARFVIIEGWGGGRSGTRNGTASSAVGGMGAFYSRFICPASWLPDTAIPVTIGQGGLGVSVNGPGNPGGNSTFGSVVTFKGAGAASLPNFKEASFAFPTAAAVSWATGLRYVSATLYDSEVGEDHWSSQFFVAWTSFSAIPGNNSSHGAGTGATASAPTSAGTSTYGGNGGVSGGAGVAPGGGGAGTTSGTTGDGARGEIRVHTF